MAKIKFLFKILKKISKMHKNILRSVVKFPDQTGKGVKSYGQKTAENSPNGAILKSGQILDGFLAITYLIYIGLS